MTRSELIKLLSIDNETNIKELFARANAVKKATVGNKMYLRGLVEFSNRCRKNCYYCGIRFGNRKVVRYDLSDHQILEAVDFAWRNRYGSIVLQSGELQSARFTTRIAILLKKIKQYTNNEIGITLSCGEQTADVYKQWFDAGAHRYLLRIETSSHQLYAQMHPNNSLHDFNQRMTSLRDLQSIGYVLGTGVIIGLPFQTIENLADDLLFFQSMNVSMVGMGPFLEHDETPMYQYKSIIQSPENRLLLSLKMVAILRLLMPNINIAATTALQVLHPIGREQAIQAGANIFMPNITPMNYRNKYMLYNNKPCVDESASQCNNCIGRRSLLTGCEIGYGEWGDPQTF